MTAISSGVHGSMSLLSYVITTLFNDVLHCFRVLFLFLFVVPAECRLM